MLQQYFNWVVFRPWQAIILCLSLIIGSFYGLAQFKSNNDPRSFFPTDSIEFERFDKIEATYGASDVLLVAIHPKNGTVFTQKNLALLEDLTATFWTMPDTMRVTSLTNFPNTQVDGDDLDVSPLVDDAAALTAADIAEIQKVALNEPALVNAIVSKSGHVAVVMATVQLDEQRTEATKITSWAREKVDEYKAANPDVDFYVTGSVVFTDAMSQATKDGFLWTLPLGMIAAIISLMWVLRSGLATFFTIVVVDGSVLMAMGLSILAGVVFQPVSSYACVIILTIGIADCIHILVSHQQQLAKGSAKHDALLESLRVNFQPILLTSVTTAIGFLCLNTSESPPIADLGNITALGVMLAFFLSITLLPALISVAGDLKIQQGNVGLEGTMQRLGAFVTGNYKKMLLATVVIMVVLGSLIPMNRFNDVWADYFDESYDVRRSSDFLTRELAGFQSVSFAFPAASEGGISEPEYLQVLDKFDAWLAQQEDVAYTINYADIIKRLNRDMNGGDEAFYKVPESRELASQYLLLYEMSLPFGLGLDNRITMNKDATLFVITLGRTSSANLQAFAQRAQDWVDTNAPDYMQAKVTGLDTLFANVGIRNSVSIMKGTLMALVMISAMIMVSLWSLRYGLISLLPNVLPAAMAFGIWGLIDGDVSLSVSIVACITLGIVVDDTVHFLSKYVRAKREQKLNTVDAIEYSFRTVGVALVATSVILVSNFMIMAFSSFTPAADLGLLTAITIVLALFVDLLFLPALLMVLERNKSSS